MSEQTFYLSTLLLQVVTLSIVCIVLIGGWNLWQHYLLPEQNSDAPYICYAINETQDFEPPPEE